MAKKNRKTNRVQVNEDLWKCNDCGTKGNEDEFTSAWGKPMCPYCDSANVNQAVDARKG